MPDRKNAADKPDTKTATQWTALVLGGTGRTGALVARQLAERGLDVHTASRRGADIMFDWDDPNTYVQTLSGVDRVYLVAPVGRIKFADQVADFLDLAARAGVRHVTYLSAYGSDRSPPRGRYSCGRTRPRASGGLHPLHTASGMGDAELQ